MRRLTGWNQPPPQFLREKASYLTGRLFRSALIWMWAVTGLRLANFLIVLPIALRVLPSEMLGLWYLMLNLVAMITLVEFGLSAAIARQATFFFAGAQSGDRNTSGVSAQPNWKAIHGLIEVARVIYSWLAGAVATACIGGGIWLALSHPHEMLQAGPIGAFVLLAISSILRMHGLFWNPLLFGLQRVRQSQQIQFTGILISYGVSLGGLLLGGGLLALAAGQATLLLYPLYRSRYLVRSGLSDIFQATPVRPPWKPIWSSTWKTGGVLLGSWLGTQALVFACAQTVGLGVSASFSLSSLVAFTLHAAAQSWLLARYPTISALWAEKNEQAIRALAGRRILLAIATFALAAGFACLVLPEVLRWLGSRTPALPRPELAALFLVAGIDLFVALHASVLASCNQFPHMRIILLAGIATSAGAFILGREYGLWGILAAPLVCQGLTTLWMVPRQYKKVLRGGASELPKVQPSTSVAN